MAAADTARLIAQLTLDDKGFSKGLGRANKELGKLESTAFRVGQHIGAGTKATLANIAKIGLVAGGVLAVGVKGGLSSLAELESAITSVDGAIEQMGFTGQVTGKQVAGWANDIEADIGAAFDDKAITQAATTLLRFGKVTPKNLKPALTVIADLATKTGDVESAATLLAKSLADPAKAAGKLSRVGIILTKAQQDQIKAMLEVNDVAGAQALILDAVAESTEGAAKASQGPYARSLAVLRDVTEDAQRALATGFLPVIQKVSDLLGKELAKPETLANIQKFGEGLAGGLDDLIEVARNLPWQQIGDSLKLGAAGATTILKMFTSLPPWVQTAVLTGWGLNKLTGGALSGIGAELVKGLGGGLFDKFLARGSSPANPLWVQSATAIGGAPGVAPVGGAGGAGKLATAANLVMKVAIVGIAADVAATLQPIVTGAGVALGDALGLPDIPLDQLQWPFGPKNTPTILPELFGGNGLLGGTAPGATDPAKVNAQGVKQQEALATIATKQNITNERLESIRGYTSDQSQTVSTLLRSSERNETAIRDSAFKGQQAAFAVRDKVAGVGSLTVGAINAAKQVAATTTAAAREAGRQTAFAIRDKDLSVAVSNTINTTTVVSVRETIKSTTTHKQYARYLS